ncbi:MAG TPA: rod shape-determining protein MreC [Chlamydiales bacterium]|nr:MAG: hypothetical protein A3F67_11165 [Verrucomicrobia bacterium RIFCSPHIGHO2_12_FULL_41_10]HLB52160.1 rod shape-determining protein MreC [Chlamydiales bacterium]
MRSPHSKVFFLFLWLALFLWTHISLPRSDSIRSFSVATLAPLWRGTKSFRTYLADRPFFGSDRKFDQDALIAELKLQNQILQSQVDLAKEWVLQEKGVKRRNLLEERLQKQGGFLAARVIYRTPSFWGNSFWIDAGEEDNEIYGYKAICRNSPVVDGNALVGVIDYVGTKQSRVRLITDSGLNPAVRVDRGRLSQKEIHFAMDALADRLEGRLDCLEILTKLKEKVGMDVDELYLAKGELRGSIAQFWRIRPILKGVGFNYNYADAEGVARDLRSSIPIIQVGDHLITSGLDGVFPFGLSVAIVKKVAPLTEGKFSYEIEAVPTASSLCDLKQVFVLPVSGE